MAPDPSALPLRPAVLHILLALSTGDLHGLGIADAAEAVSEGTVELGPGTLYRSLSEMSDAGLVQMVAAPGPEADPRRKYYRITPSGQAVLADEVARLERLVGAVRSRNVRPETA